MTATPDTHTFVNGVLDSSELNTYVRDAIRFHFNKPIAELRQTVTQTLTTGVWTAITFTAEDVDTDPSLTGGHSTSVNTSRYTAVYAGWYLLGGGVHFVANATGRRGTKWVVNGTSVNGSVVILPATATDDEGVPAKTKLVFLNVGDYVELHGIQISGGNLDTISSSEAMSSMMVAWMRNA